mgnify:CR=1 FL=1
MRAEILLDNMLRYPYEKQNTIAPIRLVLYLYTSSTKGRSDDPLYAYQFH